PAVSRHLRSLQNTCPVDPCWKVATRLGGMARPRSVASPRRRAEPIIDGGGWQAVQARRLARAGGLPLEMARFTRDMLNGVPMIDCAAARRMMVDGQVRTSDVTDLRLLAAFLDTPRERFVADDQTGLAYLDLDLPVTAGGEGSKPRCLLKPMVLAKLIQATE